MGVKIIGNLQRAVIGAVAALAMSVSFTLSVVVAQEENSRSSVQGYAANSAIDNGTIVKLVDGSLSRVETASQAELDKMFGVAVDRNQLPVWLTNDNLENETYVAVSGTHNALVSTQGGPISPGDYVTLSSISGIAMKAGTDEPKVYGRAAGSFDGQNGTLSTTTLKDVNGQTNKTVQIGSIPVTIDIRQNPNDKSTKVQVPDFLERIGQAIAEKEVSPIRIYLSMAITAVSLITALIVIYSGVKNGVISIGRNPMSKRSIFRALIEVSLTSMLILIIGLFAVYLLLRL